MSENRNVWESSDEEGCFMLEEMEPVPISSTDIRAKVKSGKDI
jgi:nicotinic acid mononucleotide adenylyltransferase